MASIPEFRDGTRTVPAAPRLVRTTPLPEPVQAEEIARPRLDKRTVPKVDRAEKGDAQGKDQRLAAGGDDDGSTGARAAADKRKAVATALSGALSRVAALVGSMKMAAHLQLPRRESSRAHDVLGSLPSEGDFLSIVVLVEAELGKKTWKEITREELTALRRAVDRGIEQPRVTFDDYNRVLRTLHSSGWSAGPVLDLAGAEESDAPAFDESSSPDE